MVLDHIEKHGRITGLDAVRYYGIMRLGAVIHTLRRDGYGIVTEWETSKNRFGRPVRYGVYSLEKGDRKL